MTSGRNACYKIVGERDEEDRPSRERQGRVDPRRQNRRAQWKGRDNVATNGKRKQE